jgi:beta-N-acetylhexosaminidase
MAMAAAGCLGAAADSTVVRPGISVLITDSLHLLDGARVGLITNQTGIGPQGRSDVDLLLDAGVNLTTLFSPEHGFRGGLDREGIGHSVDSVSGLPIYSLYGDTREPTLEMLADLDVLIVDMQDIGARTYTYISTALLAMRAAARVGVRVIIPDRPNPVGGRLVQGPILDTAASSFIGMLPVPLRHGMTMGELAAFGNDVLSLGADVTVVPAGGWTRMQWFDDTELPWVRPSPNMPNLESATHYPGSVLFEGTNLSVGRGTPIAFQVVGAPWLDPTAVMERVGMVRGVALRDTVITPQQPTDLKYDGERLPAVLMQVVDRTVYDPTAVAVRLLAAVFAIHADTARFRIEAFDRLAGGSTLRTAIEAGRNAEEIVADWEVPLESFRSVRGRYLLYPEE